MKKNLKKLIEEVIKKRAEISQHYGLTLNQEMKKREFLELKNKLITGEISDIDLKEFIKK